MTPHTGYVSLQKAASPSHSATALSRPRTSARAISIRKKYHGKIVFARGVDGQQVLLRTDFPDMPAHEAFQDNIQQFLEQHPAAPGSVQKFEGAYMLFKNGHPSFSGHFREVSL